MDEREVPTIKVKDVTQITDDLIARSAKFKAFFSRAELESHVALAMAPHYTALTSREGR